MSDEPVTSTRGDIVAVQHGPPGEACSGCLFYYVPADYPDIQHETGVCLRYPPDTGMKYSWTRASYWCGEYKPATVIA